MRWIVVLAALVAATQANAQSGVEVDSAVFLERAGETGLRVEPADRFARGDRVVTVLTWSAPAGDGFTLTSAVPAGLSLQSASSEAIEVSTDGGRRWRAIADGRDMPRGVTHLRWQARGGEGRLSYRAVVR